MGRLSRPPVSLQVAAADHVGGIVAVAALVDELDGGCGDLRYLAHVRRTGHVVVALIAGQVVGYCVTRMIGRTEMVSDLFVHPNHHGQGIGAELLAATWTRSSGPRMTFSSQHPHALPVYLRAGMAPYWPLLWLRGDASAITAEPQWRVEPVAAAAAAEQERKWLGVDRGADYEYWTEPADDHAVVVRDPSGSVVAAGAVSAAAAQSRVHHLTARDAATSAAALRTVIAGLPGSCFAAVPGPHPAVPALVAARWQVSDSDHWMASDPRLLDASRQVLSPGLA